MLVPFTENDVQVAKFMIEKIPGLDGYKSGFLDHTWEKIGKYTTKEILEFFQNGKLLRQLNATNIAPNPKVDVLE